MSSTNRGRPRQGYDLYRTPAWCVRVALKAGLLKATSGYIIDPCAGDGSLLRALSESYDPSILRANEIREAERSALEAMLQPGHVTIGNMFEQEISEDWRVFTNPAFSLAFQTARRYVGRQAQTVLLLRLGFLETRDRNAFLIEHPPAEVVVLPKRPVFVWTCATKGCKGTYPVGWSRPCNLLHGNLACGGRVRATTDSAAYGWFSWVKGVTRTTRLTVAPIGWCE